ncbi:MAG TPA: VOC family protein [Candidatus Binatia bacterium]|jgi:catechol 2,3-dioxygenase-like lactoylglutathione lyase family enzyme
MTTVNGLKGLRHVALKVRDIRRSKAFYQQCFGMEVVWEPDPQNVYLSSGCDNLALHELPASTGVSTAAQSLDHVGFVVQSAGRVRELEGEFRAQGVKIVQPFKIHRDGSASFYLADPDGIVIQMLYEPHLSPQELK